ncbi:FkbM family methyltransferase [Rhodoferax sp. WC2427]|uniref:FkbM family methyltransferase n=1 Tax=Rhodoferax sp. WC2427 TaxID=3234144 RepID=UPI0034655981
MPPFPRRLWDESLQPALRGLGLDVRRYPPQEPPPWTQGAFQDLLDSRKADPSGQQIARQDEIAFLLFCFQHVAESNAQLLQDLFVRHELQGLRGGFFVEFGAADGIHLSNSWGLETHLAWRGILAEPARNWHERLKLNRACTVETRCVWSRTGEILQFNEVPVSEFSTIAAFTDKDQRADARKNGTLYDVETISLLDLLDEHAAPPCIDYLSIDTEGSELTILEAFDFSRYQVRTITVEHNYTSDREKIHDLLTARGFQRKFTEFSNFDDWYVNRLV